MGRFFEYFWREKSMTLYIKADESWWDLYESVIYKYELNASLAPSIHNRIKNNPDNYEI